MTRFISACLLWLCLAPPAQAQHLLDISAARELWGHVCVNGGYRASTEGRVDLTAVPPPRTQPSYFGYRYNPLVATSLQGARGALEYGLSHADGMSQQAKTLMRERLALLEAGPIYAQDDGKIPAFWRSGSRHAEMIFFAPIKGDPHSTCPGGAIRAIAGEYALFIGAASPRVRGDICADMPQIVFGPNSVYNFRLDDFYKTDLRNGWERPFSAIWSTRGDPLQSDKMIQIMRRIYAIHHAQCARPPVVMELIFERQVNAVHVPQDSTFVPNIFLDSPFRARLWIDFTREVWSMEIVEETSFAQKAKARADTAIRTRNARKAYREQLGENIATGAAIIIGGFVMSGVLQSCAEGDWDTTTLSCDGTTYLEKMLGVK